MRHALAIDDQDDDTRLYLGPSRTADLLKMRPKYRRLLPQD